MRFLSLVWLGTICVVAAWGDEPPLQPEQMPAEQLFRTAMKFELEADNSYRDMTLRAAVAEDSGFTKARWALGEVEHDGHWTPVAKLVQDTDPILAQYAQLRQAGLGNAEKEFALAKWCRAHQLHDREQLHLMRVVFHPHTAPAIRDSAAKRLQLKSYNGRWLTEQQLATIKAADEQAVRNFNEWSPRIAKWREGLASDSSRKREQVMDQLRQLRDPAAITALETELSSHGESYALLTVQTLGNITHHAATMSLVRHAMAAPWPSVVEAAATQLRQRPMHEFVPALLSQLDTPILAASSAPVVYEGRVSVQQQVLFKEGMDANQLYVHTDVASPFGLALILSHREGNHFEFLNPNPPTKEEQATAVRNAALAAARAKKVQANVAEHNERVAAVNARAFSVLSQATGQILAQQATDWWDWWHQYNEVSDDRGYYDGTPYQDLKPTVVSSYLSASIPVIRRSCFAAGTPVWTDSGIRPIESVVVGDRVVAKDPDSGELGFAVVLEHTLRPPVEIMRIRVADDTIECTKGHPFWVDGIGWKMAKLLQVGDAVHGLRGACPIDAIEQRSSEESAHNLVVAGFGTYLIGSQGLLVHDNTYRAPTQAVIPGYVPDERLVQRAD